MASRRITPETLANYLAILPHDESIEFIKLLLTSKPEIRDLYAQIKATAIENGS